LPVRILTRLANIRQTIRIGASFAVSLALLGYMISPLPGTYLAGALLLLILYSNLVLMRLTQAAARTEEVTRAVEMAQARWTEALAVERSERIVGFARRDSSGELPERCLMIVAVPRSGSTWLMDALRAHPAIYLEPSAIVFQSLGLRGNRYPMGLSNGPDGVVDLEVSAGHGGRVPAFSLSTTTAGLPETGVQSYAVEKIHPEFFGFDAEAFLSHVERLRQEDQMMVDFVYQVREPGAAITSFLTYKRRDPTWYPRLPESGIPSYMERTYAVVLQLAQRKGGLIVDYGELMSEPLQTVASIHKCLWPELDHSVLLDMAKSAVDVTSRDTRVAANQTPFLAGRPGPARGGDEDLAPFYELHAKQIARCSESYQALLKLQTLNKG
jgi:hypothetical protein